MDVPLPAGELRGGGAGEVADEEEAEGEGEEGEGREEGGEEDERGEGEEERVGGEEGRGEGEEGGGAVDGAWEVEEAAGGEEGEDERDKGEEAEAAGDLDRSGEGGGEAGNCETHPQDSPQVGSVSPSHMKLPTKAQTAERKRVTGTKTVVAMTTGLTKTRRRKMCA